jgi:CubicO group peptidase (beta-lactamase class C family)
LPLNIILRRENLSNKANQPYLIQGTVAPGFESVRVLYERNMQTLKEKSTQLCVYHKDKKVVDLWASQDDSFSPDSLINVFSSGKSLETIALASLVGQGLMNYTDKITDFWPEFGHKGKQDLTVAELMRHEAGLAAFDGSLDTQDLLTENIKKNKVGKIIEEHVQKYRPNGGSRREYHAVTRGWIVNEVFRRIEPAGRTIGEYLREDIGTPLGVDAIVGVKQEELSRRALVVPLGFKFVFWDSLKPRFLGRRMEFNFFQLATKILRMIPVIRNSTTWGTPAPFKGMRGIRFFNEPALAMGETPSANTHSNARSLAKIAAMMSSRGKFIDQEFLSDSGWTALHSEPVKANMGMGRSIFTQGGVAHFTPCNANSSKLDKAFNTGREGFYGWMGLGGSIFQWHPTHRIGFGYVPTSLNVVDILNERGKAYQAEVLNCIEQLTK